MLVWILIEHEHVKDVHVHVHVFLIKFYFHEFLLVVLINVNKYLHVLYVTKKKEIKNKGFQWKLFFTLSNLDFSFINCCSNSFSSRSARVISSRIRIESRRFLRINSSCNFSISSSFLRRSNSASFTDLRKSCSISSFLITVFYKIK
jgi:hypothetical protein